MNWDGFITTSGIFVDKLPVDNKGSFDPNSALSPAEKYMAHILVSGKKVGLDLGGTFGVSMTRVGGIPGLKSSKLFVTNHETFNTVDNLAEAARRLEAIDQATNSQWAGKPINAPILPNIKTVEWMRSNRDRVEYLEGVNTQVDGFAVKLPQLDIVHEANGGLHNALFNSRSAIDELSSRMNTGSLLVTLEDLSDRERWGRNHGLIRKSDVHIPPYRVYEKAE